MAEIIKTIFPLVGQQMQLQRLYALKDSNRLGHAHIFYGNEGIGKDSLTLNLAAYINCSNPKTGPCGKCPSCLQMRQLQHTALSLIFPTPAKKEGKSETSDPFKESDLELVHKEIAKKAKLPYHRINIPSANEIRISTIRQLRRDVTLKSENGLTKIILISEAHRLNDPSANALLKILEEPPEGTVFFLTTDFPERLPITIRSRCQQHVIQPIAPQDLSEYLVSKHSIDESQGALLAHVSQGNLPLANRLAKENINVWFEHIENTVKVLTQDKPVAMINLSEYWKEKKITDATRNLYLHFLILFFRDVAVGNDGERLSIWNQLAKETNECFPDFRWNDAISLVEKTIDGLARKVYLPLAFTNLFLGLSDALRGRDVASKTE
jgi:DNA polymerase III subunit delta'